MNITGIACAAVLLLAGSAMAQDREGGKAIQQTTISLGTATPGGGFPIYGNGFAEVINEADLTLLIEPRNTKGSNENIPLLERGQLDIALVAGEPSYEAFAGIGRPGFASVAASRGGARFIAPDAAEIARIRAKHTFLKPLTVPAGSYPNQDAPIDALGSWSFILARESLPDDVAYRLARSLHGAQSALCRQLPQACGTTAPNTVAAAPNVELIPPRLLKNFPQIRVVT